MYLVRLCTNTPTCLYVCSSAPVHLPTYIRVHIYPPTYLPTTYIPIYLPPTYIPTYISTHPLPTYLPTTYIHTYLHTHLLHTTYLPTYLPTTYLPTYLPTYLSTHLHLRIFTTYLLNDRSIYPSTYPYVYVSTIYIYLARQEVSQLNIQSISSHLPSTTDPSMYLPTCLPVYKPIYPSTHLSENPARVHMSPLNATSMTGYFMSNEIQIWTVDKGEGAVRPGCNKVAEGTEARYTENTVLHRTGIPFLCMYTAKRACVISLCCGYTSKVCKRSARMGNTRPQTQRQKHVFIRQDIYSDPTARKRRRYTTMSAITTCWLS